MRIDSSGNVGIGTTSPLGKLNVAAAQNDVSTGSFTSPHLRLSNTATTDTNGFTAIAYSNSTSNNFGWTSGSQRTADDAATGAFIWRFHNNSATGTERMRIDSSGNLLFNSGYGSVATAYGCRAWVNFNGSTTPPTVNASGNVSSVTRNSTGQFTVNFTTAMPDANYTSTGTVFTTGTNTMVIDGPSAATTTTAGIFFCRRGGTASLSNSDIASIVFTR
jgi:hypothetical protein